MTVSSHNASHQDELLLKLTPKDIGWITMSVGMAIGAGIIFLPIQVGVLGIWTFLLSAFIAYPAMYLFQKLFINTLATSQSYGDYPSVIGQYLGKNWGAFIGFLYFSMMILWGLIYALSITHDSASYLQSFHITSSDLSQTYWYPFLLLATLITIASRHENVLFNISGSMAMVVLMIVLFMALLLIPLWNFNNIPPIDPPSTLLINAIITLPFTLTSILFLQILSPMVISYRKDYEPEIARLKALKAMKVAFILLFCVVFFFAISFALTITQEESLLAKQKNISALAIIAQLYPGSWATFAGIMINLLAIMTSFFAVFLALKESILGLINNLYSRLNINIQSKNLEHYVTGCILLTLWFITINHWSILSLTSFSGPIFGVVGCLIPVYLVYKIPQLHRYKSKTLPLIGLIGILLCVSPLLRWID